MIHLTVFLAPISDATSPSLDAGFFYLLVGGQGLQEEVMGNGQGVAECPSPGSQPELGVVNNCAAMHSN